MRIGFLSWLFYTLKGGGERFCAAISRAMLQRGHECVIFHQGRGAGHPVYPLPEGVKTYDLALTDVDSLMRARQTLRETQIDILCNLYSSEFEGLWALALCRQSGIPLLMSEHNSPYAIEHYSFNRQERLACLAAADGVHLLSQNYLSSLPEFLQKRATVIPNPAPSPKTVNWDKESAPRKRLLTVARLEEFQKQISLLIRAFAFLAVEFPDWDCCICGGGRFQHDRYVGLIDSLQLKSRVALVGSVNDVDSWYASSHIFCLPSAFEGSPIALLEAQSHGLPSVGFADCTGVNEIIIHGENGLLAEEMTVKGLADALRPLMKSSALRRSMGEKALALCARYDEKPIFDQWEALLRKVAEVKNRTRLDIHQPLEDKEIECTLRAILARPHPFARPEGAEPDPRIRNLAAAFRARIKRNDD